MVAKSLVPGSKVWAWGKGSWVRGVVDIASDAFVVVNLESGEQLELPAEKCYLQNLDTAYEEDLTKLAHLHEPGILANLQTRYESNLIYTWTGSILIAINPFAQLSDLYGPSVMESYAHGQLQQEVPPHIYAVAAAAFRQMQKEGKGQAILVTGESGAGKTETTKLIMRYLAYLGGHGVAVQSKQSVERKVLESNPILEAFGNAKTVRNDNSSRFGKYVELVFDERSRVCGAAIRTYLLERSRVVQVNSPERNYHVFYQLCYGASPEERSTWHLGNAQDYAYLQRSTCFELPGVNNALEYQHLRQAMTHMGMSNEEQLAAFSVVASVLHLGNITFLPDPDQQDGCCVDPEAKVHLQAAAQTLGVDAETLRKVLTSRTRNTVDGPILCPLDEAAANQSRDALAKVIYSRLFDWLVQRLNHAIAGQAIAQPGEPPTPNGHPHTHPATADCTANGHHPVANGASSDNATHGTIAYGTTATGATANGATANGAFANGTTVHGISPNHAAGGANGAAATGRQRSIGLLDIYGFEQFQFNDLEQLCINLANEKLQQHFNQNVFKWEQAEYMREGIPWSYIEYIDNQDVLDLVEGKMGVLDLLDEQCRFPRATASDLAVKLTGSNVATSSPRFVKPKRPPTAFTIVHYAGSVTYQVDNFLDKNKDFVIAEQAGMLVDAKHPLLPNLFKQDIAKLAASNGGKGGSSFQFVSVGSQFKKQLSELMSVLGTMEPHYVRCIKPNPASQPLQLEGPYVLEQLRNSGVMEAVRISCAGYPYRRTFAAFLDYYWQLRVALAAEMHDERAAVEALVQGAGVKEYQLGHTKVFMRGESSHLLEQRVLTITNKAALSIQARTRGWLTRGQYKRISAAAGYMQASIRCLFSRRELQRRRRESAATYVQTSWRTYHARITYQNLRAEGIWVQNCVRGLYARRELHARRLCKAATYMQACWRGLQAREELLRLRRERAATRAQTTWRGYHARLTYQHLRLSAIWTQNCIRGLYARRQLGAMREKKAATYIQNSWRGLCARQELVRLREERAAGRIQTAWRGYSAHTSYHRVLQAAMWIQGGWKACVLQGELRELRRVQGACLVQAAWRGREARRQAQALRKERATIIVQSCVRAVLAHGHYQQVKREWAAACWIQSLWKGRQARREFRIYMEDIVRVKRAEAATLFQSTWRVHLARGCLSKLRARVFAAGVIQGAWRWRQQRRQIPKRVLDCARRERAAGVIQEAWRAGRVQVEMRGRFRQLVLDYVELVEAVGKLQRTWRSKVARQTLRTLKLVAWRKKFALFEQQPTSPTSTSSNRSKSSTPGAASAAHHRSPFTPHPHSIPKSTPTKLLGGTIMVGGRPYAVAPRAPDAEIVQSSPAASKVEPTELEEFQISDLMSFWQTKLTPSPSQQGSSTTPPPRSNSTGRIAPPPF